MITGLVMTGAVQINDAQTTFDDVAPLARLTEDCEVLMCRRRRRIKPG